MTPRSVQSKQSESVKKLYQPPKEIKAEHQEFIMSVGDKLKQIRINRELSASQLARESKISRNLYHQMEHGKVYFTISSILQVLDYLDIPATDFFKDL